MPISSGYINRARQYDVPVNVRSKIFGLYGMNNAFIATYSELFIDMGIKRKKRGDRKSKCDYNANPL